MDYGWRCTGIRGIIDAAGALCKEEAGKVLERVLGYGCGIGIVVARGVKLYTLDVNMWSATPGVVMPCMVMMDGVFAG